MVKAIKSTISMILYFAGVILLTWFVITFIGQRTLVSGDSMETTLSDGDNLIVDKISYRFKEPERFDIIVFPFHYDYSKETYYIKRIIGLPGETVQIDEDGTIYINGKALKESYGNRVIEADRRGVAAESVTLGDDEYFVLGDNREVSLDSRVYGAYNKSDIKGKANFTIYPFSRFGDKK